MAVCVGEGRWRPVIEMDRRQAIWQLRNLHAVVQMLQESAFAV